MSDKNKKNTSKKGENENLFTKSFKKLETVWQKLGPGLVTGASDDDPSGIFTYTQSGAQAGFGLLWTALLTFPLMAGIQEMCGRIGLVTDHGIAAVIKQNYPKWIIYVVALLTIPACILNIGADLAGMGAVANMLVPQIHTQIFILVFAIAILAALILFSYKQLERVMKWLTLVLLVYLVVPFLVTQDWRQLLMSTIIPHFEFKKEFIALFVAILGTTISPYLFFWEASMESEERDLKTAEHTLDPKNQIDMEREVKAMRKDNAVGMFFSNFVMYFVILTAASILFRNGINNIQTVQDAANSLRPLAGDGAYLLFAVGIIGTGFLAIPVLAGACSYLLSEIFDWKRSMNLKVNEAKGFYSIIAISVLLGVLMNILNVDPIQTLIWSAIVYGIVSPVLIAIILHICNNKKIMGDFTNKFWSNAFGISGLVLMTLAVIAMILTSF